DYLFRASQVLGRPETGRWAKHAALAYQRLGATWWKDRLGEPGQAPKTSTRATIQFRRQTGPGNGWLIGEKTGPLPDLKGLHYLRQLLAQPGLDIPASRVMSRPPGPRSSRRT